MRIKRYRYEPSLCALVTAAITENRWRIEDIGTFDPATDDVFFFVDRIRDIAALKGHRLVQTNLITCLKGAAIDWFQYELSDAFEFSLRAGDIEAWCTALKSRWQPSQSEVLRELDRTKYTRQNASMKRDPQEHIHQVLKLAKQTGYTTSDALLMAFHRFDESLQLSLVPPGPTTTIAEFINQLKIKKDSWFGMYQYYRHNFRPPDAPYKSHTNQAPQTPFQQNGTSYNKRPYQQKAITGAHFADVANSNGYIYDPAEDAYFVATNDHPPGHTPRRLGNTHYGGGNEALTHWSEATNNCNQDGCTHYH